MKALASYFQNPFYDVRISRDRKKAFGSDSIERITVQNTSNQFDNILTDTQAVQDAFFGTITDLASDKAIREARTKSTDTIIAAFTARNSRLNNYFTATEADKEDVYLEFFPQGVQAFTNNINKENVEQQMQAMITAITNNTEVAGGNKVLTEYTTLYSDYKKARSQQLNKTGEISSGIVNLDDAEIAWNDQMFSNLLTFANLNRNLPANVLLYMNQTLLENDAHHDTTLTGKIKGTIKNSDGHPLKNVLVHIENGKTENAHSDVNGDYLTHPLPIGTWQIVYSKGEKKINKSVEISEGVELELNVVL